MSAISRKSLTPLQSCCKRFSEKKRTLVAWCMASQAFRSAPRSNWKSFSRWRGKRGSQAEVNDASFQLARLDLGGFCDGRIISIADRSQGKGTSRGTPAVLSHAPDIRY